MAFRRTESPYTAAKLPLKGLDLGTMYLIEDVDAGNTYQKLGKTLLDTGIEISIPSPRESKLLFYKSD